MNKILVVDDDPHIRELVTVFLENEAMPCIEAENGKRALEILEEESIGLIVLDIMMPEMDGWSFCSEIRKTWQTPILMLTAKGETMQKVKGFKLGADDYLVKPFEPIELVMRVKALLKRYQVSVSQTVRVGKLSLDRKSYTIFNGAESIMIPMKEFELLFMLAGTPGRTFTRDDLIENIWGFDYEGDERTVDVHVKRLRERFISDKFGFEIKTVRGLGYRLEEV
ncbi:response regulator transcription factor [Sporolactobacillus laevolacticus]|uniref:response regulator transcription factor n=1 Tax=Sporolactobacillus laevolacticus TaxID=33018 RepID=UPI0025B6080C|nr:response regulator transcription factor [Sporolactobacillus laevolacticus]MDN3953572.1 response regulator transcription factor [Sporolactobacillus laevolacticus]